MKKRTHPPSDKREDKISRAIDRVLTQVFGEDATHLIYQYLERNYSLEQDELTKKIDVFARGLEDFLKSGAVVVERKILEDIYSSHHSLHALDLDGARCNTDFVDRMRSLAREA